MITELEKFYKEGRIRGENIGFDQVIKHLKRAQKDLKISKEIISIDTEASYNYAYLGMLRAARALLLSLKVRPVGAAQHKTVVECTKLILPKTEKLLLDKFDDMRRKRNKFTYDEPGLFVSELEAEKAIKNAEDFFKVVHQYITEKNPQQKLL